MLYNDPSGHVGSTNTTGFSTVEDVSYAFNYLMIPVILAAGITNAYFQRESKAFVPSIVCWSLEFCANGLSLASAAYSRSNEPGIDSVLGMSVGASGTSIGAAMWGAYELWVARDSFDLSELDGSAIRLRNAGTVASGVIIAATIGLGIYSLVDLGHPEVNLGLTLSTLGAVGSSVMTHNFSMALNKYDGSGSVWGMSVDYKEAIKKKEAEIRKGHIIDPEAPSDVVIGSEAQWRAHRVTDAHQKARTQNYEAGIDSTKPGELYPSHDPFYLSRGH